ncbi:hypothetical protein CDL15_Pgr028150 [Punica granatum]|nr:hypothetical protein CDL15_Pgr028150 [Punica granatum]
MGSDQSLESILAGPTKSQQEAAMKKPRPQHEQALKCPRCESTNTKFCYYNNYSLSQPRYFCKSCRRYWTKGGTLRNVPVGGGCRKSKRPSKRITINSSHQDHQDHQHSHQLQDLIALNSCNSPLAALHNLAYEASNPNENFHFPLAFAHQLHKLSNGQFDGHDLGMGHHQGFLEAPGMNNLQGLYYGLGDGAIGEVHSDGGVSGESILPFEETKQDYCSGENKVLLGCPWPTNGDGVSNLGDLSSMRGSLNSLGFGSSWHSLLNSPLM